MTRTTRPAVDGAAAWTAALSAELLKVRHSKLLAVSVAVVVVFPLLIGMLMSGALGGESSIPVEVEQTPESYLQQFETVVAIGGLIGFGFLFSWMFGREFADGTFTDLLTLPVSRLHIVGAKFVVAAGWCGLLALFHFVVGAAFTSIALKHAVPDAAIAAALGKYAVTAAMVIFLSAPVAFVAGIGKGYMAPLGFVVLTIVAAQLLGAAGAGAYFPWAVPGLFSGVAGEAASRLPAISLALPFVTGGAGVLATFVWWCQADHT